MHEADYAAIKDNPKLWGSFLWVMFDFPAAPRRRRRHDRTQRQGHGDPGSAGKEGRLFYFYKANWSEAANRLHRRRAA